jgi:hypothetical protein
MSGMHLIFLISAILVFAAMYPALIRYKSINERNV